jgi:hypothetical protein
MWAMSPKNPAAVALGRKGGKATAENRTAEQRSAAARKAVEARWAKTEKSLDRLKESSAKTLAKIESLEARVKKARQKKRDEH